MLAIVRIATAHKQSKLLRQARVKGSRQCERRLQKECVSCGEEFNAVLERAKYCSKRCKWREESRGRERVYMLRRCHICEEEYNCRTDSSSNVCKSCTNEKHRASAKAKPRCEKKRFAKIFS